MEFSICGRLLATAGQDSVVVRGYVGVVRGDVGGVTCVGGK